jgi:hypothetical protein
MSVSSYTLPGSIIAVVALVGGTAVAVTQSTGYYSDTVTICAVNKEAATPYVETSEHDRFGVTAAQANQFSAGGIGSVWELDYSKRQGEEDSKKVTEATRATDLLSPSPCTP